MGSKSQDTTQYLEHADAAKDCCGDDLESGVHSPEDFSLSVDQLNQDFNKSLVLKGSSSIELKDSSNLTMMKSETDKVYFFSNL